MKNRIDYDNRGINILIKVICSEGFSQEYVGGGGEYINGIYSNIPYADYLKVPIYQTHLKFKGITVINLCINNIRIRKYIKDNLKNAEKYDIIHNTVLQLPKLKKTTVVTTIHHVFFRQNIHSKINNIINDSIYYPSETFMIRNSDYLITDCTMMKNKILRYFRFPNEKIITIDLGVDTNVYHPMNYNEEEFILFPGALRYPRRKGTYFILPVLNRLLKKHKTIKCIFTGNLSVEGKEILKNLPNNFKYIGFTQKNELAKLYNQALYVIFPSLYEGYGLIPKETIACGGVVISTDVGAVSDYLKTGINGFILKLNEEIWFQKMDNLIKNNSLRESIRKNNRNEKINSWEECSQKHFEFFKKILEEKNKN